MDFSKDLNKTQLSAVEDTEGASLIIAGAGSGKTRVLTYRIAQLLAKGVPAYKILALTFTNKASREMKSRIDLLLGQNISSQLWMGTFHSIFSSILRIEATTLGFTSDFTIYDTQDSRNLLKSIIKEMKLDDKVYNTNAIAARISLAKNNLITAERYLASKDILSDDASTKRPHIGEIYKRYQDRCKQSNVMDFDDLLMQTNILFRDYPDTLEKYRNKFSYILVDEYQDTNYSQYLIIKRLSEVHRNICVVGDDAQSIYSFRGARIENILKFKDDYPDYKLYKLEQNYRSTTTIVNAANCIIHKNTDQIQKNVFSQNEEGEPIKVIRSMSDKEEAFSVAQEVKRLALTANKAYSSFAILYRTNAQSRVLEEAFRRVNIPYRIYGAKSFYQRMEIKDILAYLRVAVNTNDEESLKRIINTPKRGLGETTIDKIVVEARQQSVPIWDILLNLENNTTLSFSAATLKKLTDFRKLILHFSNIAQKENSYNVAKEIIQLSGIEQMISADDSPEGISRKENKQELLNSIKEFSENAFKNGNTDNISTYIAGIQLLTDQDEDGNTDQNFVTMMTIHAAKGLEFDNVFITGLEEDLFPAQLCLQNPKSLEEERRLFYVAVTRAGKKVYLSYAISRYKNGQVITSRPSRFIDEIPAKYRVGNTTGFVQPKYEGYRTSPGRMIIPERKTHQSTITPQKTNTVDIDISKLQILNNSKINIGMTVVHPSFGIGEVIELEGLESQRKAKIAFKENGVRVLLLRFAKLFTPKI